MFVSPSSRRSRNLGGFFSRMLQAKMLRKKNSEMKPHRLSCVVVWTLVGVLSAACSSLAPLDQQKRWVDAGELRLRQLTPRAFVETWGEPTYVHQQFTHFFGMKDGRLIPQARMALGESPQGWEIGLEAGEALFMAYVSRGRYLVFLDETLVYQEEMSADKLHAIGKSWKHEAQFRTSLESSSIGQ